MPSSTLVDLKKSALIKALKESKGNRTHTASKLGVSVRTVRTWIKEYSLSTKFPARRGRK